MKTDLALMIYSPIMGTWYELGF